MLQAIYDEHYIYAVGVNWCTVYDYQNHKLGEVWIDHTNAWSVKYASGVQRLPINEALGLMGYPEKTKANLEA